jgi:hypothetical protein
MKALMTAAMLLAFASPAFASDEHDEYDCGNGVEVVVGHAMTVTLNDPENPNADPADRITYPTKGQFNLKWSGDGIWINDRKCLLLSAKLVNIRYCAVAHDFACTSLKEDFKMTPAQIKRAIIDWRATWPGNTVRYK